MPCSPELAGKLPPQTVPCRCVESFRMSAGIGCTVTVSVAVWVLPLAEAEIVA